ncbi:Uncharacterised conserved protein (UCP012943 [Striga hermonthica]|uniref:Uncharacterized conserved protein (UCP012943) n=1 Tax=Striga hermonthica TaxID=68872 RepID=A0A9N7MUA3_STRHE|nr:Uncharacterised conserved protein (UCP012943 [Striga hermonthica]
MGGGAMRAAAKVAGIKVGNGGVRSIKSEQHAVFSSTRRTASPLPPVADDGKQLASQPHGEAEMNGWVFACGEETAFTDGDLSPKAVLYGLPTFEEAKEATTELALALDSAYMSPLKSAGLDGEIGARSLIDNSSSTCIAPTVPISAIQAFRLLCENKAAQNVVASLASDPIVFKAIASNQAVQNFIQSQRTCFANTDEKSFVDISDTASESGETKPVTALSDIVQKLKFTVVYMMSNMSDYFQNFFGGPAVEKLFPSSDRNTSAEAAMETSFVGLAIMAIMVIVVKRLGTEKELWLLTNDLMSFKTLLELESTRSNKGTEIRDVERQIKKVVYAIEDTIDACVTRLAAAAGTDWKNMSGRRRDLVDPDDLAHADLARQVRSLRKDELESAMDRLIGTGITKVPTAKLMDRDKLAKLEPRLKRVLFL